MYRIAADSLHMHMCPYVCACQCLCKLTVCSHRTENQRLAIVLIAWLRLHCVWLSTCISYSSTCFSRYRPVGSASRAADTVCPSPCSLWTHTETCWGWGWKRAQRSPPAWSNTGLRSWRAYIYLDTHTYIRVYTYMWIWTLKYLHISSPAAWSNTRCRSWCTYI